MLLGLETRRNLVRLARDGSLNATQYPNLLARVEEDVERFVLRDVTLDLCGTDTLPPVSTPRSLDLVHLRTVLWFHGASPLFSH